MEYRTLTKLKSTYCDGLLKVIDTDGRIHTRFNQVETRTGRISSLEPNLQNIPIRTDLGRGNAQVFHRRPRVPTGGRGLFPNRTAGAGVHG